MQLTLESVLESTNKPSAFAEDSDDDDDMKGKSRKTINLQNDDLYLEFSSRSHDIGDYLQKAVNEPSESLKELRASLIKIDSYIRNEVVSQHDSLLSQSDDVGKLESDLKLIRDRVHMIENHIHRIRNGVIHPFADFKHKSKQSLNLQIGESLLRSILRIKKLLTQLNEHFHCNKDMVKSALCISEIMSQINSASMLSSGIDIIDDKRDYIYSVHQQINDLGKQKLSSGLRSLNQPGIAVGLQVFYNLGHDRLNDIICVVLQSAKEECRESVRKALTVVEMNEEEKENETELSVKSSLLMRCDKCITHHLFGNLLQIWNLEKVLRKKNDSLSRPYIELVSEIFDSTLSFWASLIEIVKFEFESAASASSFIGNVLVNEYVQLHQMLSDFYHKVESTTSYVDQTLPIHQQQLLTKITGTQHKQHLVAALDTFKQQFIDKCVDRIQQPLNILFGNQDMRRIPTTADMRTLWNTFCNELKNTEECAVLQVQIAKTIYVNGCKEMVRHLKKKIVSVTYSTSSNMNDYRHNIDIFNCIQALYFHISSAKLADESKIYCTKSCNLLYNFDCYVLYYCLRVAWYTLIPVLSSPKALSIHCQFISRELLSLVHQGSAMDYVVQQWCACLTSCNIQSMALNDDTNIAQFVKFLRMFEDEYNVDVVPSILMLQQYKRMVIEFDEHKTLPQLQKEHPNLSLYLICQVILSWLHKGNGLHTLIGMSCDEYITNAFIRNNFFALFDLNLNNNPSVDAQPIQVDIMAMTDDQYNLLQIIHDKLSKTTKHKYMTQIQNIFQRTS